MAGPLLFDRVKETSTTTGTGDFTLDGVSAGGFRTLASVLAINDTCYYCIQNTVSSEWEIGIGTFTATTTLQRTTVLASSNGGSLVSFSSGTKQVFITDPSAFLQPMTATGDIIYQAANGRPTRLPIGTNGQVLTVVGGLPAWV